MDLAKIKPSERVVEIHHPGDEDRLIGLRIGLISISDPRMKKIKRRIQDEKLKLETRGKNFKAEDLENNTNSLIHQAMTSWEWYNPTGKKGDKNFDDDAHANWNGDRNPPFNQKTILEILREAEFIADQLAAEIGDEKAFFALSNSN